MGREVRRVPKGWEHPVRKDGEYKPQFDGGYAEAAREYEDGLALWLLGKRSDFKANGNVDHGKPLTEEAWVGWHGGRPSQEDYTPDWPERERTHWQMYESTSEGTPISPVMETPEELARWLADNDASAFGLDTATYDQWLRTIRRGFAPSAVFVVGVGMTSGVAADLPAP